MERLSQYMQPVSDTLHLKDIENLDVVVNSAKFGKSQYGDYVLMDVTLPDGTERKVITSAYFILKVFEIVIMNNHFPLQAKFVMDGRRWSVI